MNNYTLGTNTSEIEKQLRKDKKKLNWEKDSKPHRWNSEEAKKANKKGHHWNSEEAKKANKKGHHWDSEEAKSAAKKRWENDLDGKINNFNQEDTWITHEFNPLSDLIDVYRYLKEKGGFRN